MKDFTKRIQELRDEMHKEIIKEIIVKTKEVDAFSFELTNPFVTWVSDWDDESMQKMIVTGITGDSTPYLVVSSATGGGNEEMDIANLTLGEMDYLYKQISKDLFTIEVY
jgi:hypothetical protein